MEPKSRVRKWSSLPQKRLANCWQAATPPHNPFRETHMRNAVLLIVGLIFLITPWLARPVDPNTGRVYGNQRILKTATSAIGLAMLVLWYSFLR